eukprot:Hpha_TRINITY_DN32898_c0_g1::TRINITY_DN32898_c0_g1_i1::g.87265::m.87265
MGAVGGGGAVGWSVEWGVFEVLVGTADGRDLGVPSKRRSAKFSGAARRSMPASVIGVTGGAEGMRAEYPRCCVVAREPLDNDLPPLPTIDNPDPARGGELECPPLAAPFHASAVAPKSKGGGASGGVGTGDQSAPSQEVPVWLGAPRPLRTLPGRLIPLVPASRKDGTGTARRGGRREGFDTGSVPLRCRV